MIEKLLKRFYALYRAFAPLSFRMSPRPDLLRGWTRWRWLVRQRQSGRGVEPSIRIQGYLRNLERRFYLAERCQIDLGCIFWLGAAEGKIEIGKNSYVGPYCFLGTDDHTLMIGRDCMIGAHCYLITENHGMSQGKLPYHEQGFVGADVTLGNNVWLGAQVVVLPGVTIGDGAIVGAGAVVTRDIPRGERWGGVPARLLSRGDQSKS